ncbi:phosphotransferase family protein [Nocardia carnea]|uniref:phosphotransferase family protein n=1 Tax=Nocardia carnea TaxID=37328 RepID=UPI0024561A40|nr:phosphotransferase family protein [Nocardia carnea]
MTFLSDSPTPAGIDLPSLSAWFATALPGSGELIGAELITGGKSNLTYEIRDATSSWILRRPPLGHVLATAHDMAREYQVMSALRETDVPVPAAYALCRDDTVLGVPFYVMEKVAGRPFRHRHELEQLGARRTRTISTALVDSLAALHRVDPVAVGLADFGRPDGFLGRQLRRWRKQLDASRTRELPAADRLYDLLASDVPSDPTPGIVHGDYRLDNLLIDQSDRTAAIIDWEMATLGAPLTDLALLVVYQRLARIPEGAAIADASLAAGFLSETEIIQRYADNSDTDFAGLGYCLGLAAFKLATIVEGIHYRHTHGHTVGVGFEHIGRATEPLLEIGLGLTREH